MPDSNVKIIERLLELAKNPLVYDVHPKSYKEEYIFLSNVINDSCNIMEREFNDESRKGWKIWLVP